MGSQYLVISPRRGIEMSPADRATTVLRLTRRWTARELRARYRQSVLRAAWSVIQPVVVLLTYGWVLTEVLQIDTGNVPYLVFAWAGLVPFNFVQQGLGQGVLSIQQAGAIVSRVYFPREVLPLSVIGCALVDLGITTVILLVLSWIQVGPPTIHLIALPVVFLTIVLWAAGVTIMAASFTVFHRDLAHAMPLMLRVLFIVSPVMYPASFLGIGARLNPIAVTIEATRDVVILGRWPNLSLLGPQLLAGMVVAVLGLLVVRRLEPRMGDFA